MSQILQLVFRVSSFWFLVNLIHILLTKLLGEKYNFYLSRNGIFIKFVQLQWHTKRFNSTIMEGFVRRYSSKIALWFTCGAYFGIIAMFSSIIILMYTFVVSFVKDTEDSSKILTPVVPGVNLPNSQIIPYLLTLLISGIFHEYGHALAAAREGVSMYGAGLFMFLIYPAAFVDLNTESLKCCDAFQRLRIFCAGVWHNCIMMVGAYIIWTSLPFTLFFLGYTKEHAVTVTSVDHGSALFNQVYSGTKIYSVNDCPVIDKVSWGQCLWKTYDKTQLRGNCADSSILSDLKSNTDCCQEGLTSPKSVCFNSTLDSQCLHARRVLDQLSCSTDSDCSSGHCYKPHTSEGYLLQLIHSSSEDTALFIGDPSHLYYTIHLSDYSSKWFWAEVPNCIEIFMIYIVSLSGALAIFNAVPAFYLDGQHMLDAFLEFVIGQSGYRVSSGLISNFSFVIQLFSTVLIAINVINAFISVCVMYQ